MARRNLHFVGLLYIGPVVHHAGGWRHPDSDAHQVLDAVRYENLATTYERGMFDGVLFVDGLSVSGLAPDGPSSLEIEHGEFMFLLEPLQVLTLMGRVTTHLGLCATVSTLVTPPYQIARQLSSLDQLSKGRAGWNIVTSAVQAVADNHGMSKLPSTQDRYDHADEVVEACLALWDTWDEDALEINRETGRFADPSKVHYIEYEGQRVKLRGGLTSPHSPQGRPVFLQAGSSPRGRQFAARWAEVIFTNHFEKAAAQTFYRDIKDRMDGFDRKPESCVVLPSVEVFVDETEALAQERAEYLDSLADSRAGIADLSALFGRDLRNDPVDTPISQVPVGPDGASTQGAYENAVAVQVDGREATLGEVAHLEATTHLTQRFVGTPESIADRMQDALESECCDGFVVTNTLSPVSIGRFADLVVPELQRRGIFRKEYTGNTFRENLQS